jgi:hypothetical protein
MKRLILSRLGASAFVAALLVGLAVAGAAHNKTADAPRSVFHRLPDHLPEPQMTISVQQLPSGIWRVSLDVSAFQFTDLCLFDAKALPIGHAHVIHNGVKIASAYQPLVDLGRLPPGRHRISAVLRGQDHRALLGKHGLIKAEVVIVIPSPQVGV